MRKPLRLPQHNRGLGRSHWQKAVRAGPTTEATTTGRRRRAPYAGTYAPRTSLAHGSGIRRGPVPKESSQGRGAARPRAESAPAAPGSEPLAECEALAGRVPSPPPPPAPEATGERKAQAKSRPEPALLRLRRGTMFPHFLLHRAQFDEPASDKPSASDESDTPETSDKPDIGIDFHNLVFSADEKWIAAPASQPGDVLYVWDAADGKLVQTMPSVGNGHQVSFSADNRLILQCGDDDSISLWERETGKLACQLFMLDDDNWAVVDPEGRFDAPNGGASTVCTGSSRTNRSISINSRNATTSPICWARNWGSSKSPCDVAALGNPLRRRSASKRSRGRMRNSKSC